MLSESILFCLLHLCLWLFGADWKIGFQNLHVFYFSKYFISANLCIVLEAPTLPITDQVLGQVW